MVDQNIILANKFKNSSWVAYFAYLANIFESIKAQGKNINIISAREIVSAFEVKLLYWKQKIEQNKIASFSRLALFLEDCENITFAGYNCKTSYQTQKAVLRLLSMIHILLV